ncbi:hypothetical protein DFH11DRAFT_1564797 [Phellopilus nigrolimitatus]|nr:hypothetical protein DFH11DRAFT_1564797 [Phellopilus nigrolimitatus]
MDDSDDYFPDSLILDDDDLAVLAAEEAKYAESVSKSIATASNTLPPAKQKKAIHRHVTGNTEDEPEIFLQANGNYGFNVHVRISDDNESVALSNSKGAPEVGSETTGQILRSNILLNAKNFHAPGSQREPSSSIGCTTRPAPKGLLLSEVSGGPARPPSQKDRVITNVAAGTFLRAAEGSTTMRTDAQSEARFQEEVVALRAQLEKLNRENNEAKEALKEAEVARFAKEGEVSILRKRIEKAAQQHTTDVVKLKETKEAADTEQARNRKEMKEQIERLRAEHIFKQHELELSTRKPTWSARSRRTTMGPQPPPIPLPSAMRGWTSPNPAGLIKDSTLEETPSRQRIRFETYDQEKSPRNAAKTRLAGPDLKFTGFENSFLQSSPVKSPSRLRHSAANLPAIYTPRKKARGKGKEAMASGVFSPVRMPPLTLRPNTGHDRDRSFIDDSIQDFNVDVEMGDGSPRIYSESVRDGSSPGRDPGDLSSVVDMELLDDPEGSTSLEADNFDGIDWSEELHSMLFSHTYRVSKTLTFHFLLSASIPSNEDYERACSSILEALGTKYKYGTFDALMGQVADSFRSMSVILWETKLTKHLMALFDLLSSIMIYIPCFTSAILQPSLNHQNGPSTFLRVLCDIALKSNDLKEQRNTLGESSPVLVHSVLNLVETIAWTVKDYLSDNLAFILRTDRVMMILLDNKQSSDVISHTIRTLVLLSSHSSLFLPLVSVPDLNVDGQPVKNSPNNPDPTRVPLLEKLCNFLIDAGPLTDVHADISSILNFFALLITSDPDGRLTLLNSSMLVPCLVYYLARLTSLIWEEDEHVMRSSDFAASIVRNIKQALHLLHRLVFPSSGTNAVEGQSIDNFDFRQKLYHAPHILFNGLAHMFVVMIGRLSYADPPEWLAPKLQVEIEKATGPC